MTTLRLDGHLGALVDLDLCPTCQIIWFDHFESSRLLPAAVLRLFRLIGERDRMSPAPIKRTLRCPRCHLRLLLTHDRQRNTPFRYWRCGNDHGRLITFFEFLREKDFIRPLSPQQLDELRRNVQIINCSNCGAPIDLAGAPECSHCGTPISMLDLRHVKEVVEALEQAVDQRWSDRKRSIRRCPHGSSWRNARSNNCSRLSEPTNRGIRHRRSALSNRDCGCW